MTLPFHGGRSKIKRRRAILNSGSEMFCIKWQAVKILIPLLAVTCAMGQRIWACATTVPAAQGAGKMAAATPAGWKSYWASHTHVATPTREPSQSANGFFPSVPTGDAWGGDIANWSAEAILANAASEALNEFAQRSDVKDVLVAFPVHMLNGADRPYGDGQTNASVELGPGWNEKRPPLMATLVLLKNGSSLLKIRVHQRLVKAPSAVRLVYYFQTNRQEKVWPVPAGVTGDFSVTWSPTAQEAPLWGSMLQNQVAFVQVGSDAQWFPLDFRDVVIANSELLAQIPAAKQKLGRGTLLDPEKVSVQNAPNNSGFPFQRMEDFAFGTDLIGAVTNGPNHEHGGRYFPVQSGDGLGIHNKFFKTGQNQTTAVGGGNTVVILPPISPFKMAYICFDARNPTNEAQLGVPSGGGWHEIGDSAETVINSLENAPVLFGYANGEPAPGPPDGGAYAMNLKDVAVMRALAPGFAIVTAAGATTLGEDASGKRGQTAVARGRNYHWFAFHQNHEVCAMEWVHPCQPAPNNNLGTNCH
jgi:hypothetical protein